MAETTGIAWTDATQNFWEGCTKVGPGCEFCYAEARDIRFHDGSHWGIGAPRRRMVDATFRRPYQWDRLRRQFDAMERQGLGWPLDRKVPPQWVFSLSLGDFFDNEVDPAWRADAWKVIRDCAGLRWQLVTKRAGNVYKMLPEDWGDGRFYQHVGIIATAVTQVEVAREVSKLRWLKARGLHWIGLSIEPQLEDIDLVNVPGAWELDWIITGGESKQGKDHIPRPYIITWADRLVREGALLSIPVFVKQLGDNPRIMRNGTDVPFTPIGRPYPLPNAGGNIEDWPKNLRVREMPRVYG